MYNDDTVYIINTNNNPGPQSRSFLPTPTTGKSWTWESQGLKLRFSLCKPWTLSLRYGFSHFGWFSLELDMWLLITALNKIYSSFVSCYLIISWLRGSKGKQVDIEVHRQNMSLCATTLHGVSHWKKTSMNSFEFLNSNPVNVALLSYTKV